ncbi:unnamed protein product, partial [Dibothriocephalus latus]
ADAYTKAVKIPSDAWPGILSWTFSGALPDTERHAFPLASERQWKQSERVGNASNAVTPPSSTFETFPAHILVERAGRLVPDELLKGQSVDELPELETFVTFIVSAGGTTLSEATAGKPNIDPSQSGRVAVTHLVKDAISPVWDYQRYGCLPLSLLSDSAGSEEYPKRSRVGLNPGSEEKEEESEQSGWEELLRQQKETQVGKRGD